jgi:hypothetical protein
MGELGSDLIIDLKRGTAMPNQSFKKDVAILPLRFLALSLDHEIKEII